MRICRVQAFGLALIVLVGASLPAQSPEPTAGLVALHQACLDASTTGVVLNVAAHPDDESSRTNVILRRRYGLQVVTVYSTFGDGGQNAIGREIGPDLARLRVRETLRAAAMSDVDVLWLGMQDFGFSKTLEETLAVWGADRLKTAMRAVVREVQPDLILTNHAIDQGHGHHRASYWAVTEVLKELAAEGKRVPPLYARCTLDKAQWTLDPGDLEPARGETYARLAHRAWTQHVTQGPWGAHNPLQVGKDYWKVDFPEGVTAEQAADWQRWLQPRDGVVRVSEALPLGSAAKDAIQRELDRLRKARQQTDLLSDFRRANRERAALDHRREVLQRILLAAAGVRIEAWMETDEVPTGGQGKINLVVHGYERVQNVQVACEAATVELAKPAVRATPFDGMPATPAGVQSAVLPPGQEPQKPLPPPEPVPGRYTILFSTAAAKPAADSEVDLSLVPHWIAPTVTFALDGIAIEVQPRLWFTPVDPIEVAWDRDVVMVPKGQTVDRILSATVTSHRDAELTESVKLQMGSGIKAEAIPGRVSLSTEHPDARLLVRATIAADELTADAQLKMSVNGQQAAIRLVPVEVFVPPGLKVGLVRGPDDTTERTLSDLGIAYTALDRDALATARLEDFTTLLLDIRAYHHRPELAENRDRILQYCRSGGRVVAMYHKSGEWNERAGHPLLAPFALKVGETRATEEALPVTFLQADHRLLTFPHAIAQQDFAGWVQERGLNFALQWDPAWTPLLELKDSADEKPSQGALLHTQYGRGDFIYCALALYRQLRQGHPGAARILVNLLAR